MKELDAFARKTLKQVDRKMRQVDRKQAVTSVQRASGPEWEPIESLRGKIQYASSM